MATRLSVGELGEEALDQFLSLDGKVLRTLKLLLFRPGALTKEFLAGRRVQYVSPLRLYLLCSLLFFTLAALMPSARQSLIRVGPSRGAGPPATFNQRMEQAAVPAGADVQRLTDALMTNLPRAVFIMMPLYGAITWLFYRRVEPYYMAHLYYSIHVYAFVFFMFSMYVPLAALGRGGQLAGSVMVLALFPYHYLALARVFGGTRWQTFVKGTAIGVVNWIVMTIVVGGLMYALIKTL